MELIALLIDFVLHVDRHIGEFVQSHGTWVYALLFAIVFVETGVVLMPFLPGDSLLFAAGALCAGQNNLSLTILFVLLIAAAILGDQCNLRSHSFFVQFPGQGCFLPP
jgi:membrane-associated protein